MVKKKVLDAMESTDPKTKRWRQKFSAAKMAYDTGEFRQAESLLAVAKEMSHELPEKAFAENATEIGAAAVLLATDRAPIAKGRLDKVVSKLQSFTDEKHQELLAVAMRFLAQALADTGDAREAEAQLRASADILQKIGADASVQLAYTLCDLCGLYLSQQRYSEAEQHIRKAMLILSNTLGPDAPEYVRADMIFAACSPMEADTRLPVAEDGIAKAQYFYGGKHPNIARALGRFFKVLDASGDQSKIDEAMKRFGIPAKATK
jgi:tetratricopeptide (TPR) repeat protein